MAWALTVIVMALAPSAVLSAATPRAPAAGAGPLPRRVGLQVRGGSEIDAMLRLQHTAATSHDADGSIETFATKMKGATKTPRSGPVGFIGLGIMGLPMAKNLLAQGNTLVVWNRSPGGPAALLAAAEALLAAANPEDATGKGAGGAAGGIFQKSSMEAEIA
eukprot:CAMPEP_0119511434 /NCGR_PEP_ID=MMETSP1344-20130328/30097_1 /TAXON_ID=236787 /ORGANISM="Florenciella parvula, Strain CCMP2471" /LENGTH=161 /DNA_ID=CAMNT_0007548439 /DNA_START=39 /DNA_END=521 /DNA_ORIENTATION=-